MIRVHFQALLIDCDNAEDAADVAVRIEARTGLAVESAAPADAVPKRTRKRKTGDGGGETWAELILAVMSADGAPKEFNAADVATALEEAGKREDTRKSRSAISVALASETKAKEPRWVKVSTGMYSLTRAGKKRT